MLESLVDRWESAGHLSNRHQALPFTQRLLATVAEAQQPYDQAMDISLPQANIQPDTPMHLGPAVFDLLRMEDPSQVRVVRITNTLKLERIQISEALVREFGGDPDLEQESDLEPLVFSDAGALL